MYTVYCDDFILYDPRMEELTILSPSLSLELNKTGSFSFSIYPDHPYYSQIEQLKSIIQVKKDGSTIFRGRVITDKIGWYNQRDITCEGELAFLLDSRVRPFAFTGGPAELFAELISQHNAAMENEPEKQFKAGTVTVTDPNDYINRSNTTYETTWDVLNTRLLDTLGGYLRVRHESDGVYLDYLAELDEMTTQPVEFGENLLSYAKSLSADEIITALIPLGAKLTNEEGQQTDKRLTIADVNGGVDYVYDQDAVDQYGLIFGTETWDDVTEAGNLLVKAQARLLELIKLTASIDLSAVDLSQMDASYDDFRLGQYVFVTSEPHGLKREKYLITKLSLKLLEPAQNTLTLGKAYSTFTDETHKQNQQASDLATIINTVYANYITNDSVNSIIEDLKTQIDQTSEEIRLTVSENYVTSDGFQEEISTQLSQTSNQWEMTFNSFVSQQEKTNDKTTTKFLDIEKYIRYEDGKIILGIKTDPNENPDKNTLTCQIANDKLSFYQGDTEVAYISNDKLYITDVELVNRLSMGNEDNGYFDWLPRQNGNLSLVWRETGTEV